MYFFYFIFYFSCTFIGITVGRYVVYLLFFPFGFDFWILPNFDKNTLDPTLLIYPFVSFVIRKDGLPMYIVRAFVFALLAGIGYWLVNYGWDIEQFKSIYSDTFDWSRDYIIGNNTNALQVKGGFGKYADIDEIMRLTEEEEAREARYEAEEDL